MIGSLSDGLRGTAHRLHPAIIEDLGLVAALSALIEEFKGFGLDVTFSLKDAPKAIPFETASAFYRIAQEALHNTLRHAPGAPASLSLRARGDQIELQIQDAGPGFSLAQIKQKRGLGLSSMKERAELIGGKLQVSNRLGGGTVIFVTAPLPSELRNLAEVNGNSGDG